MIKIQDIAYVRFTAPDLDAMESFLIDFGLSRAHRDDTHLYMKGTDGDAFVHVTERGEPGFAAVAFEAASLADLETLAAAENLPVEDITGPGGGKLVRLTDPDGYVVEVVAGRARSTPQPSRRLPGFNDASDKPRLNELLRVGGGPSQVLRIGHCVLNVTDFRISEEWYKSRFGFITSDEIFLGDPSLAIGAFMRCDRGETPSDHHTLFLMGTGTPKFNHAAFEVAGLDDLMVGNTFLAAKERQHEWGVGRHFLGSQIFDYWRDPWGHAVEHWTDGDLLDTAWGSRQSSVDELVGTQWGPALPPTMG
ncbi:MAG: glyoxalase [Rhizobiales bacterium]|nr:glyoxalase [Hyphomicrobiales bacterium]